MEEEILISPQTEVGQKHCGLLRALTFVWVLLLKTMGDFRGQHT